MMKKYKTDKDCVVKKSSGQWLHLSAGQIFNMEDFDAKRYGFKEYIVEKPKPKAPKKKTAKKKLFTKE